MKSVLLNCNFSRKIHFFLSIIRMFFSFIRWFFTDPSEVFRARWTAPKRSEWGSYLSRWNQAWRISVLTGEKKDSQVSTFMSTDSLAKKSEFQLLYTLLALVCLGMAAWAYGKGSSPHKFSKNWYMFACLSLVGGLWLAYPQKSSSIDKSGLSWQPWSPQLQDKLLAEGQAVYIDYTAKWCLSCQVNKRVYQDDSVQDALLDQNVQLLRADWTQKSPEILQSLQSYGREGVPFNVFWHPRAGWVLYRLSCQKF